MPTWEQMTSTGIEIAYITGWRQGIREGRPATTDVGPYLDGFRQGMRDRATARARAGAWMQPEETD